MRSNSEFKQKPARLSVIAVLFEAAWRTWRMRHELLFAMLLPALAVIAVVVWSENSGSLRSSPMAWSLGAMEALALAFAAVSCHRLILLGSGSIPRLGTNGWNLREWMFVGWVVIISVISTLVMVLTLNATMLPLNVLQVGVGERNSALFQWMIAAAWVPAALVVSRLSLVLPARAVDKPIGLGAAWRISKENGWRLALLIAGVPWAIGWIEWGIANLFSDGSGVAVRTALYLLVLPLEITLLSVCYQRLIAGNSASK